MPQDQGVKSDSCLYIMGGDGASTIFSTLDQAELNLLSTYYVPDTVLSASHILTHVIPHQPHGLGNVLTLI